MLLHLAKNQFCWNFHSNRFFLVLFFLFKLLANSNCSFVFKWCEFQYFCAFIQITRMPFFSIGISIECSRSVKFTRCRPNLVHSISSLQFSILKPIHLAIVIAVLQIASHSALVAYTNAVHVLHRVAIINVALDRDSNVIC